MMMIKIVGVLYNKEHIAQKGYMWVHRAMPQN